MSFDPGARLDPGQISDRRGRGGRTGVAIGGGGLGLVLLIAYALLGGNPDDLGGLLQPGAVTGPESSALATECKTGQDANTRDDCRILGFVNSIQAYWTGEFQASGQYQPVDTVLFTDATQSACGTATAASGPFYCPTDKLVYLDLGFFEDLRTRFGATGGSLAQGYVVAHEYGHHVQDLLGVLGPGHERPGSPGTIRPDGAPGRLLRRHLGESRGGRHPGARHGRGDRRRTRRGRGRRRRPDPASRAAVASTPRPGPTAHRPSVSTGSRSATRAAIRPPTATRSAAVSRSVDPFGRSASSWRRRDGGRRRRSRPRGRPRGAARRSRRGAPPTPARRRPSERYPRSTRVARCPASSSLVSGSSIMNRWVLARTARSVSRASRPTTSTR